MIKNFYVFYIMYQTTYVQCCTRYIMSSNELSLLVYFSMSYKLLSRLHRPPR